MNIACIDKDSASRLALQGFIQNCFDRCREKTGHLLLHKLSPLSLDEMLLSGNFDAFILGPSLGAHSAWNYARSIKARHPDLPCLAILEESDMGLLNLNKFEKADVPVIQTEDSIYRIVHAINGLDETKKKSKALGKVVFVEGSKGGVGVTSIISGLAHSSEEIDKKAIVLDLSPHSTFSNYLLAKRSFSLDLNLVIEDSLRIETKTIESSIETTLSGINVFLPPSCKSEVREKWLRNPDYLEYGLETVEILKEKFDLILIDGSGAEGILPFSLLSRSDLVLAVTSDDPASAYLLDQTLKKISSIPGSFKTHVVLNETSDTGLEVQDIESILKFSSRHNGIIFHGHPISLDKAAAKWPGTGNSFYTEGSNQTQRNLKELLEGLLNGKATSASRENTASQLDLLFGSVKNKLRNFKQNSRALLPAPSELLSPFSQNELQVDKKGPQKSLSPEQLFQDTQSTEQKDRPQAIIKDLYKPAQLVNGPSIMRANEK